MGIETNTGAAPTPDDSALIESTPDGLRVAARVNVSVRKSGHGGAWVSNAELAAEIRRLTGLREAGISEDRETEAALIATGHRQPTIDTETEHLREQDGFIPEREARGRLFGVDEPVPGYEDGRKELREASVDELHNARAAARRRLGILDGSDPPIAAIVDELRALRAAPRALVPPPARRVFNSSEARRLLLGENVGEGNGQRYRKAADIIAVRIDEPFRVVTEHGTMDAEAGDWLATNDPSVDSSSDAWPISAARFEASYVPAPMSPADIRRLVNRFLWDEERIYHAISHVRHGRPGVSDTEDEKFARDLVATLTGLDYAGRPV